MFDLRTSPPEPAVHIEGSHHLPSIGTGAAIWKSSPGVVGGDVLSRQIRAEEHLGAVIWLRLSGADACPGVFCAALRHSLERNAPAIARELGRMHRHRGHDDPADAAELGAALGTIESERFVVVIEDAQAVGPVPDAKSFIEQYSTYRTGDSSLIGLIEGRWWHRTRWSITGVRQISVGRGAVRSPPDDLADELVGRVTSLARGRSSLAGDVVAVIDGPSAHVVDAAAAGCRWWPRFCRRLTDGLLAEAEPAVIELLDTALRAGYVCIDGSIPPASMRPWLVPLEGGAFWLRPSWTPVLAAGLDRRSRARSASRLVRPEPPRPAGVAVEQPATPTPSTRPTAAVSARLFGPFEFEVAGTRVVEWRSRRGLGVLKYLVAHPKRSCSRDVLLDVFWTDAEPERARNRLHVAISAVRRSVRVVADVDVIEHHDHGYRVPPWLETTTDVEQFQTLVELGRREELLGRADAASDLYIDAASLYRGDFLADDPYEPWTLLPRETLRIQYLDLLDRLAQLHIAAGRVRESIDVAQRILREDDCREDAHRLLMRCYAHQGRVSQIDRQYELCRRTLASRLGSSPSRETVAVHRDLRAVAQECEAADWRYP